MYKLFTGELVSLTNIRGVTKSKNGSSLIFTYNDSVIVETCDFRDPNKFTSDLIAEELRKIKNILDK